MKEPKIKICIDSGANIQSAKYQEVTAQDLEFDTYQEWLDASEDEKYEAVQMYWTEQGLPEISWRD